jgi:hypothetical protein
MKGRWESNINVWFPFMYSQKWNCEALLFPKQNYNVLSPNSYSHISVKDLYISRMVCLFCCSQICGLWEYIIRSQTHEYRNWDCTENEGPVRIQYKCLVPIYVFSEIKLLFPKHNYNVLSPSSYTHISVRDLYISWISLLILLQGNMWTNSGNI